MNGKTIGKYRLVDRLGKGGMGTVYRAVDETLDREVAVKVLNPDLGDETLMTRFRAEATTLAKLNYPEIATIYEIYRADSDLLMVMELVRGETLDQLLQRCGPLPPERAAYLVAQVLGALAHAHAAGIVHRDLKPANIMVTNSGGIKIMDFGIARVAGAEHLTAAGTMMGTPAYMAPEQVMASDVDARADLYSAGVVFYRLLTGTLPFEADTAIGMVRKQLADPPTPIRSRRPDLPEWCEQIVGRALTKSPADRFQSAEEFRTALLSSIDKASEQTLAYSAAFVEATPTAPVRPAATPGGGVILPLPTATGSIPSVASIPSAASVPSVTPIPSVTPTGQKPVVQTTVVLNRSHLTVAAALLVVLAIGVGVLAFVALRRPAPAAPAAAASGTSSAEKVPEIVPTVVRPSAATPEPSVVVPATSATDAASASSQSPGNSSPPGPTVKTETRAVSPAPTRATETAGVSSRPAAAAPSRPTSGRLTSAEASAAPSPTSAPPAGTDPTASAASPTATTGKASPPSAKPSATPAAVRNTPAERAPGGDAAAVSPFVFDARTVVGESGKNKEHDTKVVLGAHDLIVTEKNDRVVVTLNYAALLGISFSNSKQPLWQSESGPAEVLHVDAGAFGFLKGGRNWISFRTSHTSLVLRVRDEDLAHVLGTLEERTGQKVERVADNRDD